MTQQAYPLGQLDYVFDLVLSDFGRSSALRLLREVAEIERALITRRGIGNKQFFDEYRRIMFDCVADLGYIKRDRINTYKVAGRPLDQSVLFGVAGTRISASEIEAIAHVLAPAIVSAAERGYERLRIVIPCNTLAWIENELIAKLKARIPSLDFFLAQDNTDGDVARGVTLYSVPQVVLGHVVSRSEVAKLMLVGTELARTAYQDALRSLGYSQIQVVECEPHEQQHMDDLLMASIAGDAGGVAAATAILDREVFIPRRRHFGSAFVVVQASTDLDVGIGASSLTMLAHQLVLDVYGEALLSPEQLLTDGRPLNKGRNALLM